MMVDDGGEHAEDLHAHLQLAQIAGLDGEAFGGGNRTQAADQELPANDDDHHPRRHDARIELHQSDEGSGDQQLVGNRIQQHTQRGDLGAPARQVAVDRVRERRGEKDRARQQLALVRWRS